jgi:DNA-binding NtrC family response regulator
VTTLSGRDRRFFALVARAAYENPFGVERARLDGEIADRPADDPAVVDRAVQHVMARLEALQGPNGRAVNLKTYGEEDRELLHAALLFDAFHRFSPELDELIALDSQPGRETSQVRFAPELFRFLGERGVEASECVRALELFYQMRRAHTAVATRLIGAGRSMQRLREELWNSLFTRDIRRYERLLWSRLEDFSTLLSGETGTGKGEAAQAMGRSGFVPFDEKRQRFSEPHAELFVPIHLSEYPETLLESELFGHRKGSFTGAIEHHEGVLARTRPHGTLFLDEIGEVSLPIQVKLLRVLQERTYTPLGGRESRRFAGRIVAATHRSLSSLRAEGRIRDDFFYRLSTHTIQLPSLQERLLEAPDELASLVAHLCARIVGEATPQLASEIHAAIVRDLGPGYPFPGNVRELEQCVRRVLLTGSCAKEARPGAREPEAFLAQLQCSAEELLARYCRALYVRLQNYVEVARITGLDRRTVKKHVESSLTPASTRLDAARDP